MTTPKPRTFAEWRTATANRVFGGTFLLRFISWAKWLLYPHLVRWTPRVAIAIHEPESMRVFWDRIQPGMIVVDAGANRGGFSYVAARRAGSAGRVFAFEPEPHNYEILKERLRKYANVTPVQAAVSDTDGEAVLQLDSFHAGHSLLTPAAGPAISEVRVPTTTLDTLVSNEKLPGLDVVKLDVEGVELQVIAGMHKTLGGSRAPVILCEVHAPNRPEDIVAALEPFGYRCEMVDASLTGSVHDVPVHVLGVPPRRME